MDYYRKSLKSYLNIKRRLCDSEETEQLMKIKSEGQPLPSNISEGDSGADWVFYKDVESELSTEDMEKLMHLNKAKDIRTIKKCVIFFTVLEIISISFTAILILIGLLQ